MHPILFCRYICNELSICADANILKCFREARGKFVWICGDDDIILTGALRKVLGTLSSPYSYQWLNIIGSPHMCLIELNVSRNVWGLS